MAPLPTRFRSFWPMVLALWLAAVWSILGCGQKAPRPISINGKVIGLPGKALEGLTVRFWPEEGKSGQMPAALCQADGSFRLSCPPGVYKVTITQHGPVGKFAAPPPRTASSAVPTRYQDSAQTPLRVTVVEDDSETKVLKLD